MDKEIFLTKAGAFADKLQEVVAAANPNYNVEQFENNLALVIAAAMHGEDFDVLAAASTEQPEVNVAGDCLALAYSLYVDGHKVEAFKHVAVSFEQPDAATLMQGIADMNEAAATASEGAEGSGELGSEDDGAGDGSGVNVGHDDEPDVNRTPEEIQNIHASVFDGEGDEDLIHQALAAFENAEMDIVDPGRDPLEEDDHTEENTMDVNGDPLDEGEDAFMPDWDKPAGHPDQNVSDTTLLPFDQVAVDVNALSSVQDEVKQLLVGQPGKVLAAVNRLTATGTEESFVKAKEFLVAAKAAK